MARIGLPTSRGQVWAGATVVVIAASVGIAIAKQVASARHLSLTFRPQWLLLALVGLVASQLAQAELWRHILAALGGELRGPRARAIWNVTLLGRYAPTGALQAVGRVVIGERFGVSKRVSLTSFIYEVVLSFSAAVALSALFVVRLPGLTGRPVRWLALALPVALLVLLQPRVFAPLSAKLLARRGRTPLTAPLTSRVLLVLALGYVACFAVAGLALFALTNALYPVRASNVLLITSAYSAAYVVSVLGFVLPAGLGAREAALTAALATVLPAAAGVAIAVALRLVQIFIEIALAAVTSAVARLAHEPLSAGDT